MSVAFLSVILGEPFEKGVDHVPGDRTVVFVVDHQAGRVVAIAETLDRHQRVFSIRRRSSGLDGELSFQMVYNLVRACQKTADVPADLKEISPRGLPAEKRVK